MTRGIHTPLPTPPPGRQTTRTRDRNKFEALPSLNVAAITSFKTTPFVTAKDIRIIRPVTGLCCDCLPISKKELLPDLVKENGVCNILNVKPYLRNAGWLQKRFPVTAYCLQKRAYHQYPDISMSVFVNNRLLEAIQKTSIAWYSQSYKVGGKDIQEIQKSIVLTAKKTLQRMKACISSSLINFTGWFLLSFLSTFLNNILVHRGQMSMIRSATEKKIPMIYLPLHRSHLDYILITFILCHYELRAPFVAAGDNLDIPFFNSLMRGLGGFFIRRRLDKKSGEKDIVYRTLLHTYLEELLKHNEGMEFFIEGGRSRSGKTNLPKGGLLSIITESCSKGLIPDAYIVPVSISYDKIIDGNFYREQMGLPKITENFWRAMKGIFNVLIGDYGSVRVDFCQPFSMKEFIARHQVTNKVDENVLVLVDSSPEIAPVKVASYPCLRQAPCSTTDEDRLIVQYLAEHVLHTAITSTSLMSTNLVCFLLLTKHRSGTRISEITNSLEQLVREIRQVGRDIGFCGDMRDVVHSALSLLGTKLILVEPNPADEEDLCLKPNLKLPYVFELMYYGNAVLYVYLLESVVTVAVMYLTKSNFACSEAQESEETTKEEIIFTSEEICRLLQQEFIFVPPCKNLKKELSEVIESFKMREILYQDEQYENKQYDYHEKQWSKSLSDSLSWEDDYDDEDAMGVQEEKYKVNINRKHIRDRLRFLLSIIAPTLESYLTTATYINLYLKTETAEEDFMLRLNSFSKSLVSDHKLIYNESCAMDSLKTCVKSFQKLGILDSCTAGNLRIVGLSEIFNVKDRLMHYIRLLEVIKTIS
ncbi:glycerol-3-phosphate acyltransferase 1, mitochondrial [Patella vulgata]|uniref:glycerol-3-phosphate acyltransferase 1, mitochondrial n=1 Tax=Patella vulgata TaxID=6465 RepID=UPI00217F50B0|nr:glycerol-3-phosphate acyltransferase 1, mitochondrial [Patella vulgata]